MPSEFAIWAGIVWLTAIVGSAGYAVSTNRRNKRERAARATQVAVVQQQKLGACPDCGGTVSMNAPSCPHCGAVLPPRINVKGIRCPRCGNVDSEQLAKPHLVIWLIAFFTFGLALLAYLLIPKRWRCLQCGTVWKA